MKLNELSPNDGSKHRRKRVGRGESSGLGKTGGKGHNGQKSRSGNGKIHARFEGGQTPLLQRIPKRGFSNARFKKEYQIVNLSTIEKIFKANEEVTVQALIQKGVLKNSKYDLKILGNGELTKAVIVKAKKVSESAKKKIEAVNGKIEII